MRASLPSECSRSLRRPNRRIKRKRRVIGYARPTLRLAGGANLAPLGCVGVELGER
jgi:hypothetical protein